MTDYEIKYHKSRCVEVSSIIHNYKFYRVPYTLLETKKHGIVTDCNFIVYLLIGKDASTGKDSLYVGTSTDGIDGRPTSHEKKESVWSDCIFFTGTNDKLLNNSKILYLEDKLRHLIDDTKRYKNETKVTTGKAANKDEKALCDSILPSIIEVYDILGVDLTPKHKADILQFIPSPETGKEKQISSNVDYSKLKLNAEMIDWYKEAERTCGELDPEVFANLTPTYVNFKYPNKTVAYFYPLRKENKIRVLLQGTPDWYNDPRVTEWTGDHNGLCRAAFYITCEDDLKYFRLFAEIAIKRMKTSRKGM